MDQAASTAEVSAAFEYVARRATELMYEMEAMIPSATIGGRLGRALEREGVPRRDYIEGSIQELRRAISKAQGHLADAAKACRDGSGTVDFVVNKAMTEAGNSLRRSVML